MEEPYLLKLGCPGRCSDGAVFGEGTAGGDIAVEAGVAAG